MKVRLAKKLALRPMYKLSTRWIMRFFNNDERFNKAFRKIKRKSKESVSVHPKITLRSGSDGCSQSPLCPLCRCLQGCLIEHE